MYSSVLFQPVNSCFLTVKPRCFEWRAVVELRYDAVCFLTCYTFGKLWPLMAPCHTFATKPKYVFRSAATLQSQLLRVPSCSWDEKSSEVLEEVFSRTKSLKAEAVLLVLKASRKREMKQYKPTLCNATQLCRLSSAGPI